MKTTTDQAKLESLEAYKAAVMKADIDLERQRARMRSMSPEEAGYSVETSLLWMLERLAEYAVETLAAFETDLDRPYIPPFVR